jgi:hypothetical protein
MKTSMHTLCLWAQCYGRHGDAEQEANADTRLEKALLDGPINALKFAGERRSVVIAACQAAIPALSCLGLLSVKWIEVSVSKRQSIPSHDNQCVVTDLDELYE